MRDSVLVFSLAWILFATQLGLCGKLERVAQQQNNVLDDYYAYRHISIVHFYIPDYTVTAAFKFIAKEEKTGGIGNCASRNVSLFLKSGSLPFVTPDGSKITAKLMKRRRRYYSLDMESNGDEYRITIEAPSPGDWYAIAFRTWSDPDNGKITQQGLGASCDTVLNAELLLESASLVSPMDPKSEYKVHMNESVDSAVMQLFIPDEFVDSTLSLKSSCGDECQIAVHVTADDHLVGTIVNSTNATMFFKPYSDAFHFVTLRLLSGESSDVFLQLIDDSPSDSSQVKSVDLMRKSLPDFFLFDYEHLRENATKPSAFNLTSDTLSVLSFEIGRIYDVGGTLTLGIKLVDEKEKRNVVVAACISLGYYSNITAGGGCARMENITAADIYVNSTGPAALHVPFPEPGIWHVSLKAFCLEESCHCIETCMNETLCEYCDCMTPCDARVESLISSSPCIEGRCNSRGKCMHYMSGGFVFAACHCSGAYRGFDCADDTYVLSNSDIIVRVALLTFSNLAFIGSVYVAIRREYFTEAIVYAAVMFFSTFYHACEAGEDVYSVCIMRLSVLQFCDFFNALLSIWVTLVAMASFGPKLTAFCQITGAVVLAMSAEMDRTALWVFLLPAISGSALIGLSWGLRCKRRGTVRYPLRPYRNIYFPAGLLLVSLGLVCYAFLQTRKNYYIIHSLWHVCVAIGVILLLPKRQYMK
ncbi:transmembrane protein 8B [Megachile rotundata]|uniref:transmembrane protein 8B n=1 Tax=Megachile rotundata TaxID=143995 RepID=UPI000258ED70|nr:PREDICTED: transmembrane protein 8B isoform X2 [Megachile rotundata]XP_012145080.1 PREDICTED: transmembrane protein 8B isoform X2 [Megachile rotundata]XP_012145081.1 PREDICTED: transmembrane protein 8B isoform X2 [Megachile rotundata]XP_012145082.1 PREDICTED: transmembrane protein 8B isoform X2 [Megachile rotundata]XP_012145083.1 PREDICTED: transmembrane protein 8B isoform X2 [Megachile rotundata]